jgi:hypothetical protein
MAVAALPSLVLFTGCHVSGGSVTSTTSCAVSGTNAGGCTVTAGGTVTFAPNAQVATAEIDDLQTISDGSYAVSVSAPTAFTSISNGGATTLLSVTTDTGYSSSINLALTAVAAKINPVNQGDVVSSFNLPTSSALSSWIQTVAAHTNTTMKINNSAGLPFQMAAGSGTYTITTVLTSNAVGTYGLSTLSLTRGGGDKNPCKPGMNCE